jgi:hypothetical protein
VASEPPDVIFINLTREVGGQETIARIRQLDAGGAIQIVVVGRQAQ